MKSIFIFFVFAALLSFTITDELTGRWQTKPSPKGNVTSVLFNPDNSFEVFTNKKPFTSGVYTLADSIFTFTDNGCNGKRGVYKIIFFSDGDSLRLQPLQDSCTERMNGMSRIVLGRVK